ncbi:MAG: undecaprenyl/decaprenyl-phosphate alpha-N-acetylglucosaminyl 1-phosphate transferase [Clostridia bacterium]|jgi:UDP-GlcNAc:undecaprenyl-phosphate GlcNAc-1-phosphate transferase|nr:undecaprenyl/decaprenyl-phosphate alpha-N-acetylglucosaminyl 1-phosphate transferase [Clostridia bacterium]
MIYNIEMIMVLIVFIFAFVISFLSVPFSKWLAFKLGAIAHPRERDIHKKPMPRLGGLAINIGALIAILLFSPILKVFDPKQLLAIVIGALFIIIVGVIDDIKVIRARHKLIGQIAAAGLIVASGITIDMVSFPFLPEGVLRFGVFAYPITMIWIIGIVNAVNFIDGLDGLAAGVSSIASLALMFIAIFVGESVNAGGSAVLTAALAGASVGFLPYNFNPAQIFMGDAGSGFLGYILAIAAIMGMFKGYAIVVIVLVLGLPIFDTAFAIIRRIMSGKSITEADRGHLHHRLMDSGYSHKRTVLILYAVGMLFGVTAILLTFNAVYYSGLTVFILVMLVFFITRKPKEPKA